MRHRLPTTLVALVAVALVAAACGGDGDESAEQLSVIATTSVWGDVVTRIAEEAGLADEVRVEVLMPRGVDPHEFTLSSAQAASLRRADLVVANGLGLEAGLTDVLLTAEDEGVRFLWVGDQLDPLPIGDDPSGSPDPHVWLDPVRVGTAAALIGAELDVVRGDGLLGEAGGAYRDVMMSLNDEIERGFSGLADRRLVTNHDALGYFADRYGFEVVGTVIPGGSTLAAPSAGELADLVRLIGETGSPAIFTEQALPDTLAAAVAEEFGGEVALVALYVGSLGDPGGPADTLEGLLRYNAGIIAAALER